MLSGFNAMQMQLGLLPMQSQGQPLGVPFQPAPPPPQIPHPGLVSAQAMQQQQQQMQQTIQAAQMTRYTPPPSTPIGGGGGGLGSWNSGIQLNPFMANAMGGMSGGSPNMPNAMSMMAPQYGNYHPQGRMAAPLLGGARTPDNLNPFAPTLPRAHFMTPAMQSMQVMQGMQAQSVAGLTAGFQGGLGIAGSIAGAALGSAFGPIGQFAGGWLGGKVGGLVGDVMTGPYGQDVQRGRQLQNASASWMVSGGILNPYTGQGMERNAARETAKGLRNLWKDQEFEKTGFNTQDVMRITQLASDQGLLTTARSPDDITRKVKDISKAVKNLVAITGDPDVKNAIAALGQMRDLGFQGLAAQGGAVAGRAAFARGAGLSQGAMHEMFGMPGAMQAQNMGLVGASGYKAGMAGGAFGNIAASAGALDEMQLARAGGRRGLGQINTMASLNALNQDVYMAAALRKGKGGELSVDMDAYRKAQTMDIHEVSQMAASNIHAGGPGGAMSLVATHRQELKDRLAQKMGPTEMLLNSLRQAQAMQKTLGHGATLGSSFRAMGASEDEARALELQFSSGDFYDGLTQQVTAQRREASDREASRRGQYTTPGVWKRTRGAIKGALSDASEWVSSPFRSMAQGWEEEEEQRMLQARGEYKRTWKTSEMANTAQSQAMVRRAMKTQGFSERFNQAGAADVYGAGSNATNALGNSLGFSALNDENRTKQLAYASEGGWAESVGSSFTDLDKAKARLADVKVAAKAATTANKATVGDRVSMMEDVERKASALGVSGLDSGVVSRLAADTIRGNKGKAGGLSSAKALSGSEGRDAIVGAIMKEKGLDAAKALEVYEANADHFQALAYDQLIKTGDVKVRERMEKASTISDAAVGIGGKDRKAVKEHGEAELKRVGLTGTKQGVETVSNLMRKHSAQEMAMAGAMLQGGERGNALRKELEKSLGGDKKKIQELEQAAKGIVEGISQDTEASDVMRRGVVKGGGMAFAVGRDVVSEGMAAQVSQTILDKMGKSDSDKDVVGTLASMSPKEVEALRGKLGDKLVDAELARKAGKGTTAAVIEAASEEGAKAESEIRGGLSGAETDEYDKTLKEIRGFKDTLKKEGDDSVEGTQAKLWASTAELLSGAAKDLKDVAKSFRGEKDINQLREGYAP